MLSLEACRQILGEAAPASDEELEALRDWADRAARVLLEMARDHRQKRQNGTQRAALTE